MLETFLRKGAEPLKWLLVVGIAYTLAMTIWVFFATPITSPVSNPLQLAQTEAPRPPANVNWILSKNLFGQEGEEAAYVESTEAAVQTRLPLELQSVFVSSDADRSSAIVAQRGKSGLVYRIGDNLPGNAKLVQIEHDQIYLRRAGVRETLAFPKESSSNLSAEPVQSTRPRASDRKNESAMEGNTVETYRERFNQDAEGTLEALGFEVVEGGGYRAEDLSRSPLLRQTGLQAGDVILSINGQNVGDLPQDQLELDNILAQGRARIEVRRGERRFFITATLPDNL